MKKLSLILVFCLTACGGGSDKATTAVEPPPAPLVDSFYMAVNVVVADAAETYGEPDDIANAAITEPQDSEPVAL